jgi:hypothetical protein
MLGLGCRDNVLSAEIFRQLRCQNNLERRGRFQFGQQLRGLLGVVEHLHCSFYPKIEEGRYPAIAGIWLNVEGGLYPGGLRRTL